MANYQTPGPKGGGGRAPGGTGASNTPPWVMGIPAPPIAHPPSNGVPGEYTPAPGAAYEPNLRTHSFPAYGGAGPSYPSGINPYVQSVPPPGSAGKSTTDAIFKALGRCGKQLETTTRKAGGVAGNVWNHLRTTPNITDAAMARLSQETKAFAEGGRDKIFQQTFGVSPGEKLLKSYACYLSTSTGPLIGILYLSTTRLAFCSDNPIVQQSSSGNQEWVHYKVVIQLPLVRAINPARGRNPSDQYIHIVTVDDHEFWFMGFVYYDKALKNLTEAFQHCGARY